MARNTIVISGTVSKAVQSGDFLNLTIGVSQKERGQDVVTPFHVGIYNKDNKHNYTVNAPVLAIGELIYNNNSQYKKLIIKDAFVTTGGTFQFAKLTAMATATRNAELRVLESGVMVADANIAMNSYLKSEGGETTTFAKLTVWGKRGYDVQAKRFGENCLSGDTVFVSDARVSLDKYTTRDGVEAESLSITAFDSELVFGKNHTSAPAQPAAQPAAQPEAQPVPAAQPAPTAVPEIEIPEDEIPF